MAQITGIKIRKAAQGYEVELYGPDTTCWYGHRLIGTVQTQEVGIAQGVILNEIGQHGTAVFPLGTFVPACDFWRYIAA